jgi:long-chain acyl-CoA synthetase
MNGSSAEEILSRRHWLAAYGRRIPAEINPDAYGSVLDMLEAAMQRYAEKPAFRCFGRTLTYADTDRLSRKVAGYLQGKLGVRKGDRIAVMLPNLPAFPLAMLGIVRAGAVQVNVNPLYTPRELEHQLNDAGAEIIVVFSGASPTLAEIIGNTNVKHVIVVETGDGVGAKLPSPPVDARLANVITFSDVVAEGGDFAFKPVAVRGDDLLFLQYTGGTTGLSKGAALTHRNLVANTEHFKAFMPDALRPGREVVVTALPLYHIFALMVNFITYYSIGAENWLVPNPRDMDGFIDVLRKARCTIFTGVNNVVRRVAHEPENRGGRFLRPARGDRWRRRGAADDVGEMEGDHREGHLGRLRPFGDLADPHSQSGDARGFLGDGRAAVPLHRHQAAQCRR